MRMKHFEGKGHAFCKMWCIDINLTNGDETWKIFNGIGNAIIHKTHTVQRGQTVRDHRSRHLSPAPVATPLSLLYVTTQAWKMHTILRLHMHPAHSRFDDSARPSWHSPHDATERPVPRQFPQDSLETSSPAMTTPDSILLELHSVLRVKSKIGSN